MAELRERQRSGDAMWMYLVLAVTLLGNGGFLLVAGFESPWLLVPGVAMVLVGAGQVLWFRFYRKHPFLSFDGAVLVVHRPLRQPRRLDRTAIAGIRPLTAGCCQLLLSDGGSLRLLVPAPELAAWLS